MAASPTPKFVSGARTLARLALALLVIGPSMLLIYAWVEVLNHPGISLVDGYREGRGPWVPIGIGTSLAGGVLGLLAGFVAIAIEGGWWRRALLVPAAAAAALWWLTALAVLPYPGLTGPDPITFAFELPTSAALLVLMPATLLAVLAITPPTPRRPRMQMRRVAVPEPGPRPWRDGAEERPDLEP